MSQTNKLTVAILMGGDSSERSVSFSSGRALADALDSDRFAVTVFDVSNEGDKGDASRADAMGRKPRRAVFPVEWNHLVTALYTNGFDVVFPVLHGGRGEDGTLQNLLEVAGIPYVGSRAHSCAIALDKQLAKAYLREWEIPSARGWIVSDVAQLEALEIPFPCVVKPNAGGSSVGVTILREQNRDALRQAVQKALDDGSDALIEEWIDGTEVTCAVWGEGQNAQALPVIEIVSQSAEGWYDFEAKYAAGGSQHLIPPRLDEPTQKQIQDYALRAFRALKCRGVARADFIVSRNGTPYFLELNTSPGMTETSLVPDAARAAGMEFPAFAARLIDAALQKS